MPLRHPLSRVPLSLQPPHFVAVAGYAALPIERMAPRENPSVDFFWIAEAKGFCMLLTRHPWLDIPWQETNPFPALAAQRPPKKLL
ncbi:MAG: hypothetical protein II039_07675, partial [Treponema sp.]|nr:hypothetical protein [Treponema sp.]